MRSIFVFFFGILFLLSACRQPGADNGVLQTRIDSLQRQLDSSYKPGLGEFMSGIQVHHAKLWFAGKAANWKLADFEAGEIRETLEAVKRYCTDRPEVNSLPMILPAMDSVDGAIKMQSPLAFTSAFSLLTTTCNNCHRVTKHEFNVIRVPATPPFSNQDFTKQP